MNYCSFPLEGYLSQSMRDFLLQEPVQIQNLTSLLTTSLFYVKHNQYLRVYLIHYTNSTYIYVCVFSVIYT